MRKTAFLLIALLLQLCAYAQPVNQNVSGGFFFEGEPYLAINPANPQHLVVAWIGVVVGQPSGIKCRRSLDGGQTWGATSVLPHHRPTYKSADPSLVFDSNGDVLACYVDYRQNPDSGGAFVVRSSDGGNTWGSMSQVIDGYDDGQKLPVDRPWLSIDRSGGAFDGYLYVTTKPAPWVLPPNRPYFMRSTDGGTTWSSWQYLDATGALVGNFIAGPMAVHAVAANGALHLIYPSYVLSQNLLPGYLHAQSADGGASFSYNEAWFASVSPNDSLVKAGYTLLADPSDPQHLVLLVSQNLLGDQDIYLVQTTDGGQVWSAPYRVNDDPTTNQVTQDLVWGGFDDDGDLVVTWRDRRNAAGTGYQVDSEIWASVWWKDSLSFSPNFRIADTLAAWNAILSQSGNDFMCSQMANDTLYATWGDTRNGRLNIYFVKYDLRGMVPTGVHELASEPAPSFRVFPNPVHDFLQVEGDDIMEMELWNAEGRLIARRQSGPIDVRGMSTGHYFLKLETTAGEFNVRILKE